MGTRSLPSQLSRYRGLDGEQNEGYATFYNLRIILYFTGGYATNASVLFVPGIDSYLVWYKLLVS